MQTFSLVGRIGAVALLLYSLWLFSDNRRELAAAQGRLCEAKQKLETLQQENHVLAERIKNVNNRDELEKLARERLGLVMPGEKIFYFISESAVPNG